MSGSHPIPVGEDARGRGDWFETTHWSVVLAAADTADSSDARVALETLCRSYWQPLFVFVRRQGYREPDAQDLVQGFFARLLARRDLQGVRRERGRFRSYLLAALKNFLVNDWKRSAAEKRGGGETAVSFEATDANSAASALPADDRSPDQLFDRQWAVALLQRVLDRLREEHVAEDREKQFACLLPFLTGEGEAQSQFEIAAELGLTEGAVKQAVFRLRQRYQKLLRTEVAHTVATAGDVDQELRHLIAALRS